MDVFFVDDYVGGLDPETPSLGHGVACIRGQIHQNLLDLDGIDTDAAEIGTGHKTELNIFTNQARQSLGNAGDHLIEFHHSQRLRLFPAKGEQLAREPFNHG